MGSRRRHPESQGNDKRQEAARKSPGTGMAHNGVRTATNGLTELPCSSPSCILASAATSTSPDMKIKRQWRYEHRVGRSEITARYGDKIWKAQTTVKWAICRSGQSTRDRGRVSKPTGARPDGPGKSKRRYASTHGLAWATSSRPRQTYVDPSSLVWRCS